MPARRHAAHARMSQHSNEPWRSDAKPKVQVVEFLSRDPVLPESGVIEAQPDSPSGHALNVAENGRDIEGKRTILQKRYSSPR